VLFLIGNYFLIINFMENSFLGHLDWRNAEKHFDPAKKVSDADMEKILKAVHMAPSSFGLQPYHVHVVKNDDVRAKLKEAAFGQAQVSDSSFVLVFSGRSDDLKPRIDKYFEMATGGNAEAMKAMEGYKGMMQGFSEGMNKELLRAWAERQAYIALGFGLAACAELAIDSCPMEGFDKEAFDKILGLPEDFHSVVMMAVGYRKEDAEHFPKVRYPKEDLFTTV
jgi:nitroreductase